MTPSPNLPCPTLRPAPSVPMLSGTCSVILVRHPFATTKRIINEPCDGSLAHIVRRHVGRIRSCEYLAVCVDGEPIADYQWATTFPTPGQLVTIRGVPQGGGGGGKNFLGALLAGLAIIALSFALPGIGGAIGGALASSFGGGAAIGAGVATGVAWGTTLGSFAFSLGVGIALTGVAGLLSPTPQVPGRPDTGQDPRLQSVRGANRAAPYGTVPRVFGRMRIYPPYGAVPFTQLQGNDQYLVLLFCCGYGRLDLSEHKLGDTPIEQYEDIQLITHDGTIHNPRFVLYTSDVFEDHPNVVLRHGVDNVRTTAKGVGYVAVDISFPAGLVGFNDEGRRYDVTVDIVVECKQEDAPDSPAPSTTRHDPSTGWVRVASPTAAELAAEPDADTFVLVPLSSSALAFGAPGTNHVLTASEAKMMERKFLVAPAHTVFPPPPPPLPGFFRTRPSFSVTASTTSNIRRTIVWAVPREIDPDDPEEIIAPNVAYNVRVRRTTGDHTDNERISSDVYWTVLRSIKLESPVTPRDDHRYSFVEMRVKATDQLNGVLDDYNCIAESYHAVYTGTSWVEEKTTNPAWHYVSILTDQANERALRLDRLDLEALTSWATWCTDNNFAHNRVISTQSTVFQLMQEIAIAGRASFHIQDGLYSIVRDIEQTTPIQMFTPRNSFEYSGSKRFVQYPHALRIDFINEEMGYEDDEILVYDNQPSGGLYDESSATLFEQIRFEGVTNADQLYKLGRYHLANIRLRPETHTISVDIEHLTCARGDLVEMVQNSISLGLGSARVTEVTRNKINIREPYLLIVTDRFASPTQQLVVLDPRTNQRVTDFTTTLNTMDDGFARPAGFATTDNIQTGITTIYFVIGTFSEPRTIRIYAAQQNFHQELIEPEPTRHLWLEITDRPQHGSVTFLATDNIYLYMGLNAGVEVFNLETKQREPSLGIDAIPGLDRPCAAAMHKGRLLILDELPFSARSTLKIFSVDWSAGSAMATQHLIDLNMHSLPDSINRCGLTTTDQGVFVVISTGHGVQLLQFDDNLSTIQETTHLAFLTGRVGEMSTFYIPTPTIDGILVDTELPERPAPLPVPTTTDPDEYGMHIRIATSDDSGHIQTVTATSPAASVVGSPYPNGVVPLGHTYLPFATPIDTTTDLVPDVGDLVLIGRAVHTTGRFLVKSIVPARDFAATVTLVAEAPEVLTADTGPIPQFDSRITPQSDRIRRTPAIPTIEAVRSDESVLTRGADGSFTLRMVIQFVVPSALQGASTGGFVQIRHRLASQQIPNPNTWLVSGTFPLDDGQVSIDGVNQGEVYEVSIRAASGTGLVSPWSSTIHHQIIGKSSAPPDVAFLSVTNPSRIRVFEWVLPNPPPDLAGFFIRAGFGDGLTWDDLEPLHTATILASPWETNQLIAGTFTIGIKAVDTSGNESVNARLVTVTLGQPELGDAIVLVNYKRLGWPGEKTNCHVEYNGPVQGNLLIADDQTTWEDLPPTWNEWEQWPSNPHTTIVYAPAEIDLGGTFLFQLHIIFEPASNLLGLSYRVWARMDATSQRVEIPNAETNPLICARFLTVEYTLTGTPTNPPFFDALIAAPSAETVVSNFADLDMTTLAGSVGERHLVLTQDYALVTQVLITTLNAPPGTNVTIVDKNHPMGPLFRVWDANNQLIDVLIDASIHGILPTTP